MGDLGLAGWRRGNFIASDPTARGYMQIASEPNRQRVADLSVREALATLATPRDRGPDEAEEADERGRRC